MFDVLYISMVKINGLDSWTVAAYHTESCFT